MKFFHPSVRLTNQEPRAFVSVRSTNQITQFPFVCCFCFVRAFSFEGHTKIALPVNAHSPIKDGTVFRQAVFLATERKIVVFRQKTDMCGQEMKLRTKWFEPSLNVSYLCSL